LTTQLAELNLRHVSPTAMFGGILDHECSGYSLRLRRITGFIKSSLRVRLAMVQHEADVLHMRRMLINKCLYTMCPIHFWPLLSDFGVSWTNPWFKSDKTVRCPMSCIFCVIAQRLPRLSWERSTDFTSQVGRPCISTQMWALRVVRFFIDV
jgi:hypothetical protein